MIRTEKIFKLSVHTQIILPPHLLYGMYSIIKKYLKFWYLFLFYIFFLEMNVVLFNIFFPFHYLLWKNCDNVLWLFEWIIRSFSSRHEKNRLVGFRIKKAKATRLAFSGGWLENVLIWIRSPFVAVCPFLSFLGWPGKTFLRPRGCLLREKCGQG